MPRKPAVICDSSQQNIEERDFHIRNREQSSSTFRRTVWVKLSSRFSDEDFWTFRGRHIEWPTGGVYQKWTLSRQNSKRLPPNISSIGPSQRESMTFVHRNEPRQVRVLAFMQGLCFDSRIVLWNLNSEALINPHFIIEDDDFDNENHTLSIRPQARCDF